MICDVGCSTVVWIGTSLLLLNNGLRYPMADFMEKEGDLSP